ncbi:MAG: acetate uptake transporter family protein [Deltaproteobacteria bacterium]|jgi:succinate-acetate transporter protein
MQSSASPTGALPFGEPTPLGLLGLSIGCGALLPIAFGMIPPEPARAAALFSTAAWFCLLFGAGCQFLAGMMSLANKNTLGGTLLTTFSFNWVMNWYALREASEGRMVDPTIVLAVDLTFLVIFVVLTYAFGFFSKLLFAFLLDIDLLYVLRIARHFTAPGDALFGTLSLGIAVATLLLMAIALYIAFAMLVNPASGRTVFPIAGPMWAPKPPAPPSA